MRTLRNQILTLAALFLAVGAACAQPTTGTIAGTVSLKGEAPPPRFVTRSPGEDCGERPLVDQSRLVSTGGRVPWAFLWIAKGKLPESPPPPVEPAVLQQDGCQFMPHVLGVRKGQQLRLRNEDGVPHTVRGLTRANPRFEQVVPARGEEAAGVPAEPELLAPIECEGKPWMRSTLWVIEHPYFAVSDGDGRFFIENVPPGTYAVAIGHETFHGLGRLVVVKAGETSRLDFLVTDITAQPAGTP